MGREYDRSCGRRWRCIIGSVCVPLIGGGEATLDHPNERGVGV